MSDEFETFTTEERNYFESKGGEAPVKEAPEPEAEEEEVEAEEPEAKADDAETDEPEAEERPKKDGRVALRKFRAEEERRKAAEKQAAELREQFARADERLKLLAQAQQPPQPQEEPPPDPAVDPIGALQWQQKQIEAQRQAAEQQQRSAQEQAVISQIDAGYRRAFSEFSTATPDAPEAYQHFTSALGNYFQMLGVPDAQIDALVVQEERKLAYQAAQRGQNPAEIVYNLAKQFGYQPKAKSEVETATDEAVEKAEKDIDRRQKAAAAAKSLSAAGGSRGGRMPSMAELASMSDEEFADMRSRMSDREFRRLAGG